MTQGLPFPAGDNHTFMLGGTGNTPAAEISRVAESLGYQVIRIPLNTPPSSDDLFGKIEA